MMEPDRFIRFLTPGDPTPYWGRVLDGRVHTLDRAPWLPGVDVSGPVADLASVRLLAPVEPTKIVALGYNYRDLFSDPEALARADEVHYTNADFEPLVFLKAPNTVIGPDAGVAMPPFVTEAWVEVEIAAVVGRRARNLASRDEALEAVFGITIANDVTALNAFGRDWHLARSKSLDGFCPVGPVLVEGVDQTPRAMKTRIDGRLAQDAVSDDRVLDTLDSVRFVSSLLTLEPGDLVLTGTPRGARQATITPGDEVVLEVEGVGVLRNRVTSEVHSADDTIRPV